MDALRTHLSRAWWWTLATELRRTTLAALIALAASVGLGLSDPFPRGAIGSIADPDSPLTRLTLVWIAVYLASYVVLTALLLRQPWERLAAWGANSREATWQQRYLLLLEPGGGMAILVAYFALLYAVTLVVSPTRDLLTLAATAVLLVASWGTILVSFTLDYLRTDARHGWTQLHFPDAAGEDAPRCAADYVYFATSVSTTFGTTDVTVTSSLLRRRVAVHAVVAFVFNTIVIAVAFGAVSSLTR